MTPDMKRLCTSAWQATQAAFADGKQPHDVNEAIVRAVLTELRDVSGETEGYREGLWSRRNVEALVRGILAEPATE